MKEVALIQVSKNLFLVVHGIAQNHIFYYPD